MRPRKEARVELAPFSDLFPYEYDLVLFSFNCVNFYREITVRSGAVYTDYFFKLRSFRQCDEPVFKLHLRYLGPHQPLASIGIPRAHVGT